MRPQLRKKSLWLIVLIVLPAAGLIAYVLTDQEDCGAEADARVVCDAGSPINVPYTVSNDTEQPLRFLADPEDGISMLHWQLQRDGKDVPLTTVIRCFAIHPHDVVTIGPVGSSTSTRHFTLSIRENLAPGCYDLDLDYQAAPTAWLVEDGTITPYSFHQRIELVVRATPRYYWDKVVDGIRFW
jgi:hypothetical protein